MKKLILLLALSATVTVALAQNKTVPIGRDAQQNLDVLGSKNTAAYVQTFDERYKGVKGTPFFLAQWGKADLLVKDKFLYEQVEVKYNVYDNNLLYRKPDGSLMVLELVQVSSLALTDSLGLKTYSFKRLNDVSGHDAKTQQKLFVLLHEGAKTKLALLPVKNFVKADYQGGYSANRNYDELVDEHQYYFVDATKQLQRVKLTKKNLLRLLSDKQSQISSYLAKERVDAATEQGWVKTLAYYETL